MMIRLLLLAMLTALATTRAAGQVPRRMGVVMSSNDGGHTRARLRYANSDAAQFAMLMQSIGGIAATDMRVLRDADRARFRATMDELKQQMAAAPGDTELVFYYSGHADESGLLLHEERIAYDHLKKTIEALPAKTKVVIVDACFSGSLTLLKGGTHESPFISGSLARSSGYAVVTSSSPDESSQESERLRASIFTHHLLSGLRGTADLNGDRRITMDEAYRYAYEKTIEMTAKTQYGAQHPSYDFQLKGRGDFVLTDLQRRIAALELSQGYEGHFYLKSAGGHLIAEMTKKKEHIRLLALEPGSYELIHNEGQNYHRALFKLESSQVITLSRLVFENIPMERVALRGDAPYPAIVDQSFSRVSYSFWPASTEELKDNDQQAAHLHLSPLIGEIDQINGLGFGLVGHISKEGEGIVASLGFTYNQGTFYGGQLGFAFNGADSLRGLQLGSFNAAMDAKGGQFGILNQTSRLVGGQLGLINIGGQVSGVQVGLINIADRVDGLTLAPIIVERSGILTTDFWLDGLGFPFVSLRTGTQHFFTALHGSVGGPWPAAGMGFGVRLPFAESALALDVSWYLFKHSQFDQDYGYFNTTRLYYQHPLTASLDVLVGLSRDEQRFSNAMATRLTPFHPMAMGTTEDQTHRRQIDGWLLGLSHSLYAEGG